MKRTTTLLLIISFLFIPTLSFAQKSIDFDGAKWAQNLPDKHHVYYRSKIDPHQLISILKDKTGLDVINTLGQPDELVTVKEEDTQFYKYIFNPDNNKNYNPKNEDASIDQSFFMVVLIKNAVVDIVKVP